MSSLLLSRHQLSELCSVCAECWLDVRGVVVLWHSCLISSSTYYHFSQSSPLWHAMPPVQCCPVVLVCQGCCLWVFPVGAFVTMTRTNRSSHIPRSPVFGSRQHIGRTVGSFTAIQLVWFESHIRNLSLQTPSPNRFLKQSS